MAQTIIVDISTRGANPVAYTHQGDTDRTFFVELYENGEPFAVAGFTTKVGAILPADRGYTVIAGSDMVSATKSNDGTNKLFFTLTEKYTRKAGNGILTLILTTNTGTPAKIRPINIDLRIQRSADGADTIAGASDFPATMETITENVAEELVQQYLSQYLPAITPNPSAASGVAAEAKATGEYINEIEASTMRVFNVTGNLLIDNTMIDDEGRAASTNTFCASDFLNIYGSGGRYAVVTATVYGYATITWYDENKNVLGMVDKNNCSSYGKTPSLSMQTFNILMPSEVYYIRCCAYKADMVGNMRVCVGAFNDIELVKAIDNKATTAGANIASVASEVSDLRQVVGPTKWRNVLNPEEETTGAYIRKSDGVLASSSALNATGYMLLQPNSTYYVNNVCMSNFYGFYTDKSETAFVASPSVTMNFTGDPSWKGTIVTGNTPYYFRGSIDPGRASTPYVSNFIDAYLPYGVITVEDMVSTDSISGKILVVGDSISTDSYGNYKKWVTMLQEQTKLPTTVTNSSQHATGFVAKSENNFPDFIERVTAIPNKSSYDMVIVFGGINDYIQGVPMGGETGETDINTYFKPAVDYFFDYLIKNFTQARICVLLPLRTYNPYPNTAGEYQQAYSEYIHDVAKTYCLPVLNLTEESGFCPFITEFKNKWTLTPAGFSSADGVHPTEEYQEKYLAPMIWGFIRNLINN